MNFLNDLFVQYGNWEYWRLAVGYMFVAHQSGLNMIPAIGQRQALEAWAADKIKS